MRTHTHTLNKNILLLLSSPALSCFIYLFKEFWHRKCTVNAESSQDVSQALVCKTNSCKRQVNNNTRNTPSSSREGTPNFSS